MIAPRALALLLVLAAFLRLGVGEAPRRSANAAAGRWQLPRELAGEGARPAPLDRSEQLLATRQGVTLTRVAYGSSQVALVTTDGVKELHPPEACLRSAGLEIVTRAEEALAEGCALRFEVRRGGQVAWLFVGYLEAGSIRTGCSSWRRLWRAALAQLAGNPRRGAALEVMDRDRSRARQRLLALLVAVRASERRRG